MNVLKRMNWNEWFVDLILKKWSEPVSFWRSLCDHLMTMWSTDEMELSLQSPAHFVDLIVDLIFKQWSEPVSFFFRFLSEIELLLQSRAHFVDLIFKKCNKTLIFLDFYVKSSSRYNLVHILSTTFRIEARTRGKRDPPVATTDGHFMRKKQGFAPESLFNSEIRRSQPLTLPN